MSKQVSKSHSGWRLVKPNPAWPHCGVAPLELWYFILRCRTGWSSTVYCDIVLCAHTTTEWMQDAWAYLREPWIKSSWSHHVLLHQVKNSLFGFRRVFFKLFINFLYFSLFFILLCKLQTLVTIKLNYITIKLQTHKHTHFKVHKTTSILQWGPQFDQFPLYFLHLPMFVPIHHWLPLLQQLFSPHLPVPSPAPHQSLFCSTISKSATVLSLSSFGLSPHFHLSVLVFPWGSHLPWCFITTLPTAILILTTSDHLMLFTFVWFYLSMHMIIL